MLPRAGHAPHAAIARRVRRAFTLIEAALSLAIVSLVLVAALSTTAGTARALHVRRDRSIGASLAHDLMNEILGMRFEEPDDTPTWGRESSESGGDRLDWDDVDDYDGWSASPPVRRDGTPIPDANGWTREVTVQRVSRADPAAVSATDTGLVRIQVTVISPSGEVTVRTGLRSRHGAGEQAPVVDTSYVSWVGVELRLEAGQPSVITGTHLVNHIEGAAP